MEARSVSARSTTPTSASAQEQTEPGVQLRPDESDTVGWWQGPHFRVCHSLKVCKCLLNHTTHFSLPPETLSSEHICLKGKSFTHSQWRASVLALGACVFKNE